LDTDVGRNRQEKTGGEKMVNVSLKIRRRTLWEGGGKKKSYPEEQGGVPQN